MPDVRNHSVLKKVTPEITFTDLDGDLADPTEVQIHVQKPNGTKTTYQYNGGAGDVERVSLGVYRFEITPAADEYGPWKYDWQGTGAVVWYGGRQFKAVPRQVTP